MPHPPPRRLLAARRLAVAACVALVVAGVVAPAAAVAEAAWLRPVPGAVVRPFDFTPSRPFAGGFHRGADLAAPPGARVRAACSGTVAHAGPVAGLGRVVTIRCGTRRVTYLPLRSIAVAARAMVPRGGVIGSVAPGHGGLHLGVRRAVDRFGYEDPLALVGDEPLRPPIVRPHARVPRTPAAPRPAPAPAVVRAPPGRAPAVAGRLVPRRAPATLPVLARPARSHPRPGPAPWPVWVGLAALLAGGAGSGTLARRRRRRAPASLAPARARG